MSGSNDVSLNRKTEDNSRAWMHSARILYGCDYNPEVLAEDIRLMKLANINCVSMGIFSWAALEPAEGQYEFGWLEEIIQKLYEQGIYTILATPTAAVPSWMTEKYEEVMQVEEDGIHGLNLDWRRFVSEQLLDFCRAELPPGVTVTERKPQEGGETKGIWFLQNFNSGVCEILLKQAYENLETGEN